MRLRFLLGLLLGVTGALVFVELQERNARLFEERVWIGEETSVSVGGFFLAAFLFGFLPLALLAAGQTLRAELAARKEKRRRREEQGLEALRKRAADLQADEQAEPALAELEGYLARRPEDVEALLLYGAALRAAGRAEEALEVHRRALRLEPDRVRALLELAADFRVLDQPEAAREVENRILREHAGFGWSVLRRRRQDALAAERWTEVLRIQEELDSRWAGLHESTRSREASLLVGLRYRRALEHYEEDKLLAARQLLEELVASVPGFLPARLLLGEIAALEEKDDEAVRIWTEAYRATGSPIFLQRLEDHWIEAQAPEEALAGLRSLIGKGESDVLPRFFLGRLYYRLEMHDEALRELETLEERIAHSPTYRYLLARIRERRGEKDQALAEYRLCLREIGLGAAEYRCRVCASRYREWRDYCARCQSWNSVEMDFEEEKLRSRDLGIADLPVWGIQEEASERSSSRRPGSSA